MENKIILVTGSTDGIGRITAAELARQGHTIIIHGRNKDKAETVRRQIIKETGNQDIGILIADFLLLAEVKRAAEEIKSNYKRLDVLINNAGAIFDKNREITTEGYEKTIALNLFAPFLLSHLLLELLENSGSGRIINLSSMMHRRGGQTNFNDFQLQKGYKPTRAYGLSKLYLIWISRRLAKELKEQGKNITVNVCHPGVVATTFGQDVDKGLFINLMFKIATLFMITPEQGAKTGIYLAASPEVDKITGTFFGNKEKEEKPSEKYYSAENEQKVWDYCMESVKEYL